MKKMLEKYTGILFFYLVIIGMIFIINARFNYLNKQNNNVTYALNN